MDKEIYKQKKIKELEKLKAENNKKMEEWDDAVFNGAYYCIDYNEELKEDNNNINHIVDILKTI